MLKKGDRFGHWTVLRRLHGPGNTRFMCRCDCGTEKAVHGFRLKSGDSKSCRCMQGAYGWQTRRQNQQQKADHHA